MCEDKQSRDKSLSAKYSTLMASSCRFNKFLPSSVFIVANQHSAAISPNKFVVWFMERQNQLSPFRRMCLFTGNSSFLSGFLTVHGRCTSGENLTGKFVEGNAGHVEDFADSKPPFDCITDLVGCRVRHASLSATFSEHCIDILHISVAPPRSKCNVVLPCRMVLPHSEQTLTLTVFVFLEFSLLSIGPAGECTW